MAKLNGHEYSRRELEARVGSMKQIADLRRAVMTDGRENGAKIIELSNCGLNATIVESRCLDIANLSYKGIPLNFTGKNGIVAPDLADPVDNPLRSVNGGMFYTCGLSNVGGKYGDDYFHGRIRLIPAEQSYANAKWEGDEYLLTTGGIMRQNGVLQENMSLERKISSALGSKTITIEDTVSNDGFNPAPFMMMYHVVFGFPLLDEAAELYMPCKEIRPELLRVAAPSADGHDNDGGLHRILARNNGESTYALYNHDLKIGVAVNFDTTNMPLLAQWKCMQSGDYALGIMPSNCNGGGRQTEMDYDSLKYIPGGEKKHFKLQFIVIDGDEELEAVKREIAECKNEVKF